MSNTTLPPMTLGALATATGLALRALRLSDRCYSRGSAYHDYVSLMFYVPHPMPEDHRAVSEIYGCLCKRHGWAAPRVTVHEKRNEIMVTLHESSVISSDGNRRMPL